MRDELAPAVLEQVQRLGGRVVARPPGPPGTVQTSRGTRPLPGPIDHWLRGVLWPRKLRFAGEIDGRTWRWVDLGVGGSLTEYACADERDYFAIALLNKGNDFLLVDLDAPDPSDPEVCRLAHDSFDGSPWGFDDVLRLSQFLARLQPMR